jgi:tetratricopeptide (TPR) repeat protein
MTSTSRPARARAFATGLAFLVALAACDSAEERAEAHYQNALSLIEAGDVPRAIVELRTVFTLDGSHRDARATLARTLLEQGKPQEAASHYLRLVEQYPNDVEARLILAELAILSNDFETAETHGASVMALAPDSARARIVDNALAYRDAITGDDTAARREAARRAEALRDELPDSVINRTVIIDNMMIEGELEAALAELDSVQEVAPQERRFYQMRLAVLGRLQDDAGVERTLQAMVRTFPEDRQLPQTLMQFYSSRGDLDGAESFLRDRIVPGERDDAARVSLIRFLADARGREAALAEAETRITEGTNDDLFRSLRASLLYDAGQRAEALREFEDIVANADPGGQTNDIKASYARILARDGNEVGARSEIEEVLASDPGHVPALIMRSEWMIEADLTDDAIVALRRAQDQAPDNPEIFSRLAEAYFRNGDRQLGGEMLALAAQASNRAPEESLAYARYLVDDERFMPAETVLVDALRLSPRNTEILTELGDVYLKLRDWPRAEGVERALRGLGTDAARLAADRMRVTALRAQQRDDEAIAFLEELVSRQQGYRAAEIAIVTTHLERGDIDRARAYLEELIAEDREDPGLRFLLATVRTAEGDLDGAEAAYRDLIEDGQGGQRVWLELIQTLNRAGKQEEARKALRSGLSEIPEAPDLMWMRATFLERQRDYEGAIAIYEDLYSRNSATSVIANNLASLLSTARDDEESLNRAARIARRLRDSQFAPYQDTYGWIQHRLGNHESALEYLRPAARGLPDDPLVQLHLGMTYAALDRPEDAIRQFERALELAGSDPRPAFEAARAMLAELQKRDSARGTAAETLDSLPQSSSGSVSD